MLRAFVIALGIGCIVASAVLAKHAWPASLELGIFGALVLIGTIFEGHYRSQRATGRGWQTTGERFVDPTSGKMVEVRYNPRTGERSYVDVGEL